MNARDSGGLNGSASSRLRVGSSVLMFSGSAPGWEFKAKAAVVVARVALEGQTDRRRISAMLWPDSDVAQARSNLRVLTHRINQRFGGEMLVGKEHLALDESRLHVESHDVEAVLAALDAGGAERCELLSDAGLEPDAGEELQAWLNGARQRLKQAQLTRLGDALAQALALGWHDRAAALAKACVQLDPLSEHRHQVLMDVLVRAGDRAAALAAYEDCKGVLKQQLGVLPGLQTRAVQFHILREQALGPAAAPAQAQPPTSGAKLSTTLGGLARYPLVERDSLLAQAQAALAKNTHVVVHGEPGAGKTRLLRHLACGTEDADCSVESVATRNALKPEPYAALAQWLQALQLRRSPTVGVPEQIELARLAPLAFAGVKPSEAALSAPRLHAALKHWWARLGAAGVRWLVLDDVQYADAASQAALACLFEGTESADPATECTPTLLLGHRSGEIEAVLDQAITNAQTHHGARRLEVPRLTLAGIQALLTAVVAAHGTHEPAALAQQLHKRTGGNPLFVIELAQQALEQGHASDVSSLQALLDASLKRCGTAAQQLAAVAAVAAEDFTVELATSVTGQTALALMPAWAELQQRGLFAGYGLAHDLVRDAVLTALPQAILQELHRQVGQHLESQGLQGPAVLRHWLAADDADHALPHAVQQLHATHAAGLPTVQCAQTLLGLLERASDRVLMDRLWLTAEIDINLTQDFGGTAPWPRLRALRQRVERLPAQGTSAVWVAFEAARDHLHINGSVKDAYGALAPVAGRLPQRGMERARVEHALSLYANQLTSEARGHVQRAKAALVGLPEHPSLLALRAMVATAAAVFLNPAEGLRSQRARWRAALQRGDLALAVAARAHMAHMQSSMGNPARALRHYAAVALGQGLAMGDTEDSHARYRAGTNALDCGHYDTAQQLLAMAGGSYCELQALFMTLIQLRLGDLAQAQAQAQLIAPDLSRRQPGVLFTHAHVRAELARQGGHDPVTVLQEHLAQMREQGVGGTRLERFVWEISLRSQTPTQRLPAGERLVAALRRNGVNGGMLAKALLEVSETRAQTAAADPASPALAAEAARLLQRGCTTATLYLPAGLLRCARLLHASQPQQAAALVHVAQRWVKHALPHVPATAHQSFVQQVAVNRLLLQGAEHVLHALRSTAPLC